MADSAPKLTIVASRVGEAGSSAVAKQTVDNQNSEKESGKPSTAQVRYLRQGLHQAGGKLPLFNEDGQEIVAKTIRACIEKGWAEPWFDNPVKPNWLVCKLTEAGRKVAK